MRRGRTPSRLDRQDQFARHAARGQRVNADAIPERSIWTIETSGWESTPDISADGGGYRVDDKSLATRFV